MNLLHTWALRALSRAALLIVVAISPFARADAPLCRYVITPEIVTDKDTGLVWQRSVQGAPVPFAEAREFCSGLALDGGGWQLPTAKELNTIVDEVRSAPAIDPTAFPDTPSSPFWAVVRSADPWVVDFSNGQSFNDPQVDTPHHVRCVRPLR